jgi:hypothetical protein
MTAGMDASPLAVLARITANRRSAPDGERCEMCGQPIGDEHSHVVNLTSRSLLCTCRACYLLFTDEHAELRYRSVPDRFLSFSDVTVQQSQWDALQIPVGLAFFFRNSQLARTVAFYPGPAGAAESELPMGMWDELTAAHPQLGLLRPDVEAIIVRAPDQRTAARDDFACYLVPIDACYELVGRLRRVWRGFDGGSDAQDQIEQFFETVAQRSRPAPSVETRSMGAVP